MSNQLTPSDLMRQAVLTSHSYLSSAIRIIDEELGEGYAKAHPELIVGFMKTSAMDFHTAITHQKFDDLIAEICDSLL
ncbi:hypothetical protein W03_19660 [Nitrosomonas sp. PY1]|uniref:hypothetical protein n=1 Tax=Nitrosomonas sp. PY1 TaxID=1803906 RepID=UPI001FC83B62|nr:hypothetical protein [Nitrosomonas sp. PY1]GKS69962.1 hypothetical protein W03_19660 [Nitrosomonas sp. PY1]